MTATLSLALTLCALAPLQQAPSPGPQASRAAQQAAPTGAPIRRRLPPVSDQRLKAFEAFYDELDLQSNFVLGGTFSSSRSRVQVGLTPLPRTYTVTFTNPGSNFTERVLIGLPAVLHSGTPAPMMVMFHGYNRTEASCYSDAKELFSKAQNRGWYVVAPLGAHRWNYGIDYAQSNIEYALTFLQQNLPIDPERIYGVGFSMGGGGAMSYGARHLDPGKPRFAAIVNHTGGASTALVYWNSMDTTIFNNQSFFGGSPAMFPFRYSQASALDIDPVTFAVDPDTDLIRNLQPVPLLNIHAAFDPNINLVLMTQIVFNWSGLIPNFQTFLLTPNFGTHHWDTLDENTVLNFLYSKTLSTPTEGVHRVLADRDARWHHFSVTQDAAGAFTPFRWNYDALANRLTLDETENLLNMKVHCADLGLDTALDLEVIMSSTDGLPESTTLTGYSVSPLSVLRAGVPTLDWTWDSQSQCVTLTELNPAAASTWKIVP